MSDKYTIERVEAHLLDVPLLAPFTISSTDHQCVNNVAVELQLTDGSAGWGEIPTLPPVTAEEQSIALNAARQAANLLVGRRAGEWRRLCIELDEYMPDLAAVRAGLQMALIDAFTRSLNVPLFRFFGGVQDLVVTDITIPICAAADAERLAARYKREGFETIKTKVGRHLGDDLERVQAIRRGHPQCRLILDANGGYSVEQALACLTELRKTGIELGLFEQPLAREDWDGLSKLARESGVTIAADESCVAAIVGI